MLLSEDEEEITLRGFTKYVFSSLLSNYGSERLCVVFVCSQKDFH